MQTLDEMAHELLERGIDGAKLSIAPPEGSKEPPATFEGARLKALMAPLDELEKSLTILQPSRSIRAAICICAI